MVATKTPAESVTGGEPSGSRLIIVAMKIGTMDHVKQMASGVISFPPKIQLSLSEDADGNGVLDPGEDTNGNGEVDPGDFPFYRFFGALVFAGAGGFGNLFYAFYLRDKGIGMGKRFPMLQVDIRGKQERSDETEYVFAGTPENKKRFRDWFRLITYDTTVLFGLT